ncbi:hypothetical protein ACEQ8H_004146 [Pleosporales sp. CAS-2024a]
MAHPHHPHHSHQQYPPPAHQQPHYGHPAPPVQTQNLNPYPPPQHQHQQGALSPPYQQSPTAMSPSMLGGIPPAKRQRLSPNPPSPAPYQSPFAQPPYPPSQPPSPYAMSPQYTGHLSVPGSPATQQPPPFHQPQPYPRPNGAPQGSMPPPKVPYSKAQDDAELEKPNGRDSDVNNLSDVLSGGIVDLRAEEDLLLHSYGNRTPFHSQAAGASSRPNPSFNHWSQQSAHGAFQGAGALSQGLTQEQHEAEFLRKHEQAARILNESAQQPLTDPFLAANVLRHRIAKRAYETGIQVNLDGLFDKIPEKQPRESTRTVQAGANGEQVVGLEAASLLNQNAPLVEILSLITLAAEERIRTLVEDAYALSQGRQHTSHGLVPPQLADIAAVDNKAETKMVAPVNILKSPWEAADSAASPISTANKQAPNAARLPTPPTEAPPTPQRTFKNTVNPVANHLKRRVAEDEKYEKARLLKRQKRQQGTSAHAAEVAPVLALPPPDKMTKKDKDALKKQNQTDDVLHRKANETASMALGYGKKKKYSWMTGGGGGGGGGAAAGGASGAATPKPSSVSASASGAATPAGGAAAAAVEKCLVGRKRRYGADIESTEMGAQIQVRDLVHVLEHDGREKKTLALMLARLKNTERDENNKADLDRRLLLPAAATAGR